LPRKFKTAIGLPDDNCVDLYANDLGFMAIVENDQIIGYNVLVGGSMGVTPSAEKTFPAVALRMAFIKPEEAVDVATAVILVQRDFGNRSDRKVARMKYLVHNWGIERFREKVEEYFGAPLAPPRPIVVTDQNDGMGWHAQGDGKWFYGLNVENGRIKDEDDFRLKTALRKICTTLKPGIRLTPHQSMLFTDLAPADRPKLESILREHGVKLHDEISNLRRWSMACVAWPTCGLAITESERALPGIVDELEVELARLGLDAERFTLRMTGCPNGCARPYNCDIGLVGKAKDKYTIFVGGRLLGDRLNFNYKDMVPHDEIVPSIVPLFAYYKTAREEGETLGDFLHRKGRDDLIAWAEQYRLETGGARLEEEGQIAR
jgi:sulfite reductase (ferredoxin)